MSLPQQLRQLRTANGLTDETAFKAWLFEESLPLPENAPTYAVVIQRLREMESKPTPAPSGYPLRDEFNALVASGRFFGRNIYEQLNEARKWLESEGTPLLTVDDLPRCVEALRGRASERRAA